jgi:hypothetical protein
MFLLIQVRSYSVVVVLLICAMECRHTEISCFRTSGSRLMEYEEVETAAALVSTGKNISGAALFQVTKCITAITAVLTKIS